MLLKTVRLLVVGGPTHAFGMSTPSPLASATRQGRRSTGGIREWARDWGRQWAVDLQARAA